MAMRNINARTFYPRCSAKGCKTKLSIQLRPSILVEVVDGKKSLASSVREEMLLTTSNYGLIKHNCNRLFFSTEEDDGLYHITTEE